MTAQRSCIRCEQPLGDDAPAGICPRCDLEAALICDPSTANLETSGGGEQRDIPSSDPPGLIQGGTRFGDYLLMEEIARGGMGIVFLARQISLNRVIAIKMILAGQFAGKEFIQRFRGEAAAAAVLQHPNIVTVYEVGIQDGRHYFSMEYVEGRNLTGIVGQQPLAPKKAARYVKAIAEAIHYAHEKGILHRDLKPSNILIDEKDQPRVTDFGLAKALDGKESLTVTGQLLGTPNFMPPEQASPQHRTIGRTGDVYGLGAVLYYLLTARAPFQADSLEGVVMQVLDAEPIPPRLLNPAVPRDLETICLKCLEKLPQNRFPLASEVAAELDLFLRDEPIRSRPITQMEKAWRWARRKPALASAILAVAFLLSAVGMGSPMAMLRINRALLGEQKERLRAERNLYTAEMNLAHQALEAGDLGRARELLERHRTRQSLRQDLRGWEWFYLQEQCRGDEITTIGRHSADIVGVRFADGGRHVLSGSADGVVMVWDIEQAKEVEKRKVTGTLRGVSLSPDGQLLATLSEREGAKLWDRKDWKEVAHFPGMQAPYGAAITFSPDGSLLAMTLEWGKILTVAIKSPEEPFLLPGDPFQVRALDLSNDGQWLASGGEDRLVKLWSLKRREQAASFAGHTGWVSCLAFSPDNQLIASAGADKTIRIWRIASGEIETTLNNSSALVWSMAFSPDGRTLVTGGADQRVCLWDTATWRLTASLRGHESEVRSVAFSPDGFRFATGSRDGTVKLWSRTSGRSRETQLILPTDTEGGVLSADGRRVVIGDVAGQCQGWQLPALGKLGAFRLPADFTTLALGHFGKTFYSADTNGVLRTWDVETGRPGWSAQVSEAGIDALALSPDDRTIVVGGDSPKVRLWDLGEQREIRNLTMPFPRTWKLALSSDGSLLAVAGTDHSISLWNIPASRLVVSFRGHAGYVDDLVFSPDDRTLASASSDGTAKLFDLAGKRELASLRGSLLGIKSLAFTGTGQRLIAGTSDGLIKVWELNQFQEVLSLRRHGHPVQVGFLSGGQTLVSFSRDSLQLSSAPFVDLVADPPVASAARGPETVGATSR